MKMIARYDIATYRRRLGGDVVRNSVDALDLVGDA